MGAWETPGGAGSWGPPEVPRSSQGLPGDPRGSQDLPGAPRGSQHLHKALATLGQTQCSCVASPSLRCSNQNFGLDLWLIIQGAVPALMAHFA